MLNRTYENEFNLHVNENLLPYERISTRTRFEKEAKSNSEMGYCDLVIRVFPRFKQFACFHLELSWL